MDTIEIVNYIHEISVTFNCDKKTIIKQYVNYIIRQSTNEITNDFLNICQNIIHTENANIEITIKYMCSEFKNYFKHLKI